MKVIFILELLGQKILFQEKNIFFVEKYDILLMIIKKNRCNQYCSC